MRKLILMAIIVIILVSLNWFREVFAQDLQNLSDLEKQALKEKYQEQILNTNQVESYRTAPIFDSSAVTSTPATPDTDVDQARQPAVSTIAPRTSSDMTRFSDLEPFGRDLFRAPKGEVVPPNDIASSDDYILGPGDNVIIYLWGRVEQEYNLTLDREGKVFIPKVGEVTAWGMTLESFREQARRKLSSVYSDFDLTVSLGKIRSIRIYLTGEVNRPGAYTVSSLTSLFNSLYLAGGPSDNGTMRNIKLMRNGKAVAVVDLYDFLLRGDNSLDVKLESGDAIFVPVTGPRAAIRGQVKRPAIYELKDGERMRDLLNLAGGATAAAYLDRVMLERISSESEWEVVDLNLSGDLPEDSDNVLLADGDRITVYSIFDFKKNMIAVYGHVKHPGYYERNDSTRISSLIQRAQLQPYDVYYDRANLFRRYSDYRMEVIPVNIEKALAGDTAEDFLLQDRDSLHVYSVHDVTWDKYVSIAGEVKSPGTYPLYENMTARDLIFLAGSYNRSASRLQAELAHVDSLGDVSLEYVSLTDSALAATYLSEDDRLFVRQIPEWQLHRTVTLKGKVKYPGEYVLGSRKETLYELLQRAGGFAQNAFPQGLVFERETIGNNLERQRVPELVQKSSPVVQDSTGNLMRQMLFDYEPQSVNRIIIDMDRILATQGRSGDILLEPGDNIFVPSVPSGVTILGAVGANGTIKYTDRNSVKDYIERAGDFTPQADKKGTRLIRANGEVISGKHALGKRVELGDVIVVPTKIKKEHDWGKTLTTVLTATTSVLTTVLIIDKL